MARSEAKGWRGSPHTTEPGSHPTAPSDLSPAGFGHLPHCVREGARNGPLRALHRLEETGEVPSEARRRGLRTSSPSGRGGRSEAKGRRGSPPHTAGPRRNPLHSNAIPAGDDYSASGTTRATIEITMMATAIHTPILGKPGSEPVGPVGGVAMGPGRRRDRGGSGGGGGAGLRRGRTTGGGGGSGTDASTSSGGGGSSSASRARRIISSLLCGRSSEIRPPWSSKPNCGPNRASSHPTRRPTGKADPLQPTSIPSERLMWTIYTTLLRVQRGSRSGTTASSPIHMPPTTSSPRRLQAGLQRFAKPWWRRRAVRIFRDKTSLAANPELWSSITKAMDRSDWFILLLSPEAAASEWVNREIDYWLETKQASRIIPVVTDGAFSWAHGAVEPGSTAAPPSLYYAFTEEPRWVNLAWARTDTQLDLRNAPVSRRHRRHLLGYPGRAEGRPRVRGGPPAPPHSANCLERRDCARHRRRRPRVDRRRRALPRPLTRPPGQTTSQAKRR